MPARFAELYLSQRPSYSEDVLRSIRLIGVLLAILSMACAQDRRYPIAGQVIAVDAERREFTVKHGDIKGFMPGMTMPFRVPDAATVEAIRPGDLIAATLVVRDTAGHLEDVRKTGEAPLPASAGNGRPAAMLAPGDAVPDAAFVDQDGRTRALSDWRGQTLAVTFVYTRCPLPNFCPLMDRHFAAVQKAVAADPSLAKRVQLLSVSFDPAFDTPTVLTAHAGRAGADDRHWTYLTGEPAAIDAFAAGFGVTLFRGAETADEIMHNLRTAVIDPGGRLATVLNGSDWTPAELLDAIRAADGSR